MEDWALHRERDGLFGKPRHRHRFERWHVDIAPPAAVRGLEDVAFPWNVLPPFKHLKRLPPGELPPGARPLR